jgi:hypothetical protein
VELIHPVASPRSQMTSDCQPSSFMPMNASIDGVDKEMSSSSNVAASSFRGLKYD